MLSAEMIRELRDAEAEIIFIFIMFVIFCLIVYH